MAHPHLCARVSAINATWQCCSLALTQSYAPPPQPLTLALPLIWGQPSSTAGSCPLAQPASSPAPLVLLLCDLTLTISGVQAQMTWPEAESSLGKDTAWVPSRRGQVDCLSQQQGQCPLLKGYPVKKSPTGKRSSETRRTGPP